MIKACIFDLDGTLLDTLSTISYYGNLALGKFNLPPIETEKYKYLVGNGARLLVERMLKTVGAYSEPLFNEVFDYYNEQYNADVRRFTTPYPGIVELLTELKERKILTGVISNKPDFAACGAVNDFLPGLIDAAHGQIDGIAIKPAPDGARRVLDELGVTAEESLYIGDTRVDMQTGKNLGAFTVGVLWGFRDYDELSSNGADIIIEKPSEIIKILDSDRL